MSSFFAGTIDAGRTWIVRLISRVQQDFLAPLYANAYALVLNQVLSAGLGVIYWALAAHLFSAEVVGQNSAIISTMLFLSALAELSMKAAMSRFVPRAGRHVTHLILSAYTVNILASLLVTLAFFALGSHFSFTIALLTNTLVLPVILIFVPLFWTIFTVQDGVLTGLREAKWVLYENTIYNIIKIFLLVLAFLIGYRYSLAASWFLPTVLLILIVNGLVFFRFTPRYLADKSRTSEITVKQVASSVSGDYVGNIFAEGCVRLLPLLVLNMVGESANAYFYQAWLVGNTIYLIAYNLMTSFSVEASSNLEQIAVYSRRILLQKARVVAPLALAVLVFAPLILRIFGREYAIQGTTLLQWLAVATFPMLLNIWYLGYVRVLGNIFEIIRNQAIIAIITLGLSYIWLPKFGISAVGVAWLLAQSVVAIIVIYKTAPLLLSRVSNYSSDKTLSRDLLMRRADWRFLTSIVHPRKSICYTASEPLAKAVAAITLEQVVNKKNAPIADLDLAVAINPDLSTLKAALLALRSGGVCYTEWDAWRMGGANKIHRQLEKAGFTSVRLFWAYPTIETPHVWLPIELGVGPYTYLVQQGGRGKIGILYFVRSVVQYVLRALVHSGFVPHLCAIAYKEVESPPDFIGMIREEWSRVYGAGSGDKLSYIFKTGGVNPSNSISYTLFNSNDSDPSWIVKMQRLPENDNCLEQEYWILSNLNIPKEDKPALAVPRPIFRQEHLGVHVTCQTAIKGIPLNVSLQNAQFETLAGEITRWQINLADRSRADWPHLSKEQVSEELLAKLQALGAALLEPQELAQALSSSATLKDLPLVCAHNDFTAWNLMRDRSGLGVFDWTDANWSGYPMLDLVYSLSTLAFLLEDAWETAQRVAIYSRLLDAESSIGKVFTDCLYQYVDRLEIPRQRIPCLRLATWIFHCYNEYRDIRIEFGTEKLSVRTRAGVIFPLLKAELMMQLGTS